ncbi:MAG: hypothetical protein KGI73_00955 [Patescibacteria group bacterium]|nr:hypothetical protein [Patescibacteria group bacterium]
MDSTPSITQPAPSSSPFSASVSWRAVAVGFLTAVGTAVFSIAMMRLGLSPLPKPVAGAFAATLLGHPVPLPVGILFHVVYVTFWGFLYVYLFRNRLTFLNALWLGLFLWLVVLVGFFPYIGWGFFGLAIGPKLIVGSLVPHLVFVVLVWAFAKWLVSRSAVIR